MDGYEYEAKVLWPKWNAEEIKAASASKNSINKDTKERLKNELGLEIKDNPIDIELRLADRLTKNPDNFLPELSPDYELWKSTRKSKWG
jgi:hypothetical protein